VYYISVHIVEKEMSESSNNTDNLKTEAARYSEPSKSTCNVQEDEFDVQVTMHRDKFL